MKRVAQTILLIPIFILCILSQAFSSQKMKIAVMEMRADGVSKRTAKAVSNMIRTEMIRMKKFTVIERSQMNMILREQGFQMTGCTDQKCAVKMGRLLSARKMLLGEVSSTKDKIIITVRIVDVEKGVAEFAASEDARKERYLRSAVRRLSKQLVQIIEKDMLDKQKTMTGYYLRGLVPGWGQFYANSYIKGSIFLGTFFAAGGFMTYAVIDFNKKNDAYNKPGQPDYDKLYDDKKKAAIVAYTGIGILVGVYLINVLDIIFFNSIEIDDGSVSYKPGFNNIIFTYVPDSEDKGNHRFIFGLKYTF
ncbi:CsgG/HfaB family protein [Spirochaetota bacterium]